MYQSDWELSITRKLRTWQLRTAIAVGIKSKLACAPEWLATWMIFSFDRRVFSRPNLAVCVLY
ncbi:hypothetical protein SERLADRAFT_365090 [Serpula lacrymans var. lacrymans S7.9]|uniref:Uncharacterized protein n=1 Tax=Serpula lacrymans var. lacrymans (strain S7.9) TaxID=578457 RepID=F8NIZ3_SERL9|nr:uncharacterized protein SERLADRAFT_365090 [Serpula lacrymans var. lacrymans S7.9]EGO29026.1 hypothetical protein SERLADRAFT_365090 [Serpula lacrymans var. lacrymans S7.9]